MRLSDNERHEIEAYLEGLDRVEKDLTRLLEKAGSKARTKHEQMAKKQEQRLTADEIQELYGYGEITAAKRDKLLEQLESPDNHPGKYLPEDAVVDVLKALIRYLREQKEDNQADLEDGEE
jgi:glycine/D-amino acid oxidase-like deaminating enzyme